MPGAAQVPALLDGGELETQIQGNSETLQIWKHPAGFGRPIARKQDLHIVPEASQRGGQSANDIRQASGLRKRHPLRRDKENFQLVSSRSPQWRLVTVEDGSPNVKGRQVGPCYYAASTRVVVNVRGAPFAGPDTRDPLLILPCRNPTDQSWDSIS